MARSISHFNFEPVWGHGASVNRRGEKLLINQFGGMGQCNWKGQPFWGDNYFSNNGISFFFDHVDNSAAGPVYGFHIFSSPPV